MNQSDTAEHQEIYDDRSDFLIKTYLHLVAAIALFVAIESYFFSSGIAQTIARALTSVNWLFVLGAFMVVSYGASHIAHVIKSKPAQYLALGIFVLAEAIIFVPLLYAAENFTPGVIESAAQMTLVAFLCLTAVVYFTKQDFSFLRSFMIWGGLIAIALISASSLMSSFSLGYWFSAAMVVYAGGAILYTTSNVLHHYGPGQHVAAALELFSSVALMMWYVVQIFMDQD